MTEEQVRQAVIRLYDWIRREHGYYLDMWEHTEDEYMKTYYGEKTSTYTSIKLYMEKYMKGLI